MPIEGSSSMMLAELMPAVFQPLDVDDCDNNSGSESEPMETSNLTMKSPTTLKVSDALFFLFKFIRNII
jgi:hypothetical protein